MTDAITQRREDYAIAGGFDATREGPLVAGAAVAATTAHLGLGAIAARAGLAATALVDWLAQHGHADGLIHLTYFYSHRQRELELRATDTGSYLPAVEDGDRFRAALAEARDLRNGAERLLAGRAVWCVIKVPPPYTVRYTWQVPVGVGHARQTFEPCETQAEADRAIDWALRNRRGGCGLYIVAVALRREEEDWQSVYCEDDT